MGRDMGERSCMVANLSACDHENSKAFVDCLRGKSAEEMLAITKALKIIPAVVDGAFLPRHPQELLSSADFQPVPCIIGVNNDEYGWIIPSSMGIHDQQNGIDRGTSKLLHRDLRNRCNPNSEGLLHWPVFDQDERYLQLNVQPVVGQALKAHRLQFWTHTLPQRVQELRGAEQKHTEL
ncbi:cocaine esterase-like [Oryctolagus cuniculus]|uniref:cocaine esterase-like n=1 Tax=Oryctolagus cuniculus TaxID=9986 RepID=UPI003879B3AA